jgi:hypothetical protein
MSKLGVRKETLSLLSLELKTGFFQHWKRGNPNQEDIVVLNELFASLSIFVEVIQLDSSYFRLLLRCQTQFW